MESPNISTHPKQRCFTKAIKCMVFPNCWKRFRSPKESLWWKGTWTSLRWRNKACPMRLRHLAQRHRKSISICCSGIQLNWRSVSMETRRARKRPGERLKMRCPAYGMDGGYGSCDCQKAKTRIPLFVKRAVMHLSSGLNSQRCYRIIFSIIWHLFETCLQLRGELGWLKLRHLCYRNYRKVHFGQ